MNTKEQAPECCPFCGAARKPACGFAWFTCGTSTRRDQTPACAHAERERLTRERDDLATRATALAVQVDELTRELEAHAHDLSPAMVQARNDQLAADNTDLLARVKRLEEAMEACAAIIGPRDKVTWATDEQVDHAWELYTKAKEAKP